MKVVVVIVIVIVIVIPRNHIHNCGCSLWSSMIRFLYSSFSFHEDWKLMLWQVRISTLLRII